MISCLCFGLIESLLLISSGFIMAIIHVILKLIQR